MQNKLLLLAMFTVGLLKAEQTDFKLLDANKQVDKIIIKPIRKSRQERRKERQKLRQKKDKSVGLIAKSIREQTVAELKHNLAIYLKNNNEDLAIKYLEALIAKVTDFIEMRDLRLQLADLYFKNERYDKAGSIYREYYEAYPGYMSAEYALAQAIISKHKQLGACDQDNTITKEVLDLGKLYLQNKSYLKYQQQIQELFQACSNQLFESEILIFEYWFKNGYLKSAQMRLDYMRDKLLPKQPEFKTRVDDLQGLIDQAKTGKNPLKLLKAYHRSQIKKNEILIDVVVS